MGKVIVIAGVIVVLASFAILFAGWYRTRTERERAKERGWAVKGDMNGRDEQILIAANDQAAAIFWRLLRGAPGPSETWTDVDVLSTTSRDQIHDWLTSRPSPQTTPPSTKR